jgi:hypothetical protein
MKPSKLSYVMVWKRALFVGALVFSGLLSLSSCGKTQRPSFIIVALDHLSFNSFSCVDERTTLNSGLDILCKEAMRFTHAYTTSVQPAAAVGSLLSGSYPYVHGLHRSWGRIQPQEKLLSEIADSQGYRTSFFSGSPAIMKKTGLSRGFDSFDDLSFLDKRNYITPFSKQAEAAFNWMTDSDQPFLTVIYSSELESLNDAEADVTTLEKFDESLAGFFSDLKRKDLWESSYVIVLGLQGVSDYSRPDETVMSNLHSENTNITMFVKPPRRKGDEGMNWKIDTFVTTADLGWSLIQTIDDDFFKQPDELFPALDFSNLWKKTNETSAVNDERNILIETVNPWADGIETRYAILQGNLVYVESQNDELFNSLNDGLETIDISSAATSTQTDFKTENRKLIATLRQKTKQDSWLHFKTEMDDWIESNRDYWSEPNSRPEIFEAELARYKKTKIKQPLTSLLVQNLTTTGKTEILKDLGLKIDAQKSATEKESYFEEARRQSMNLSLENLWGLWGKNKAWDQSTVIKEYQ